MQSWRDSNILRFLASWQMIVTEMSFGFIGSILLPSSASEHQTLNRFAMTFLGLSLVLLVTSGIAVMVRWPHKSR
jgi:hypothetical protein